MSYKMSIVIEQDDHGYYAYCPELKGCQSQGESYDEALAHIKEAIELYLESLTADERQEVLSANITTSTIEVEVA